MMHEGLTDKQRKFCEEYMLDFNGTQAAIRAGYSEETATVIASQTLILVNVQNYLSQLKSQAAEQYGITKQMLVNELRKVAMFDIRRIYDDNDSLKSVKDLDDDSAGAVAGIDSDEIYSDGEIIGRTKKVKLHNKISAIERISKMLGYDAPTQAEISGRNGLPIAVANEHRVIFEDFSKGKGLYEKAADALKSP